MKNYSKIISVLLTIAILATIAVIPGSALATEITAGNTKETATNIPQYGIDYVSSLSKAEEVDWFKFTTLSEDAFYNVYFENYNLANTDSWSVNSDYSPHLYLYDENMKQLEWCYTGGDRTGSFNLKLESSTEYYIKILMGKEKKDSIGNYQITISAKLDNIPDTLEESSKIQLNTKIISSLDGYPVLVHTAAQRKRGDAVRFVAIAECSVEHGKCALRRAPGQAERGGALSLTIEAKARTLIDQAVPPAGQQQLGHQVFKGRSRPGGHAAVSILLQLRAAQTTPVIARHIALGDGHVAGQPRLAREQVVPALRERIRIFVPADVKQSALFIVQRAEIHPDIELFCARCQILPPLFQKAVMQRNKAAGKIAAVHR